jgi:hypothetical protein
MERKAVLVIGIIISLAIVGVSFAEDAAVSQPSQAAGLAEVAAVPAGTASVPAESAAVVPAQAAAGSASSQMQWLWGEAVDVDTDKKQILVRYQDYDTEEEKEMTISVDDQTGFENVRSLNQIQAQDVLSVDYKVAADTMVEETAKGVAAESVPLSTSDVPPAQAADASAVPAQQ